MAGQLDEISRVIGQQEANLKGLNKTFDQHCIDDDRRHDENLQALKSIEKNIRVLTDTLTPLVQRVSVMSPIVESYQISRWRTAGAVSLASAILVGIGWLVTSGFVEILKWAASHIKIG